jgi:hypothetical protein
MRNLLTAIAILVFGISAFAQDPELKEVAPVVDPRPPQSDPELRSWLENMIWYHQFSHEEIHAATGLSVPQIDMAIERFQIHPDGRPDREQNAPLEMLPYPGGRHPRIGFLDGAVKPQRETKLSVFTPWDPASYVVLDIPEAIWSHLGLTYLAHTHVPTLWSANGIELARQEWQRADDHTLRSVRRLPNGIEFGTTATAHEDRIELAMWLTNGTQETLSDLRVQNCVMLKGAAGFDQQTNDNKFFLGPYVACHSPDRKRWIITAWKPLHRGWANAPCPCLHSDPKFPDCAPGETQRLRGWLSFYEGTEIEAELARIEALDW